MDPEFKQYQFPATAVDAVLFTIREDELQVGLFKRNEEPYKDTYVLPGRFVRYEEPIEETARIALREKGALNTEDIVLEQLYTFGQTLDRDTRIRTISIVYYAVLPVDEFQAGTLSWFTIDELPQMGFDHKEIIEYAYWRLQNKVLWDEFAFAFLPELFTLTDAQRVYELVLGKELDKRNFRKKIQQLDGLEKTRQRRADGVHRPAALYRFNPTRKPLLG